MHVLIKGFVTNMPELMSASGAPRPLCLLCLLCQGWCDCSAAFSWIALPAFSRQPPCPHACQTACTRQQACSGGDREISRLRCLAPPPPLQT